MLKGINKARIRNQIWTRHINTNTLQRPVLDNEGKPKTLENGEPEMEDYKQEVWSEWELERDFPSISLAKKHNGRGSVTFSRANELPN